MTADVATLGLAIDSRQVVGAKDALDKLVPAARQAQVAVDGLTKSAGSAGAALTPAANAAGFFAGRWKAITDSIAPSTNAVKLNAQQIQNLSFQINDIGTMLASGQSPFVLLMQQGLQIAQIFGPGVGVRGALSAIGPAIMSFVGNPLTLAVVGFSAAAGAADIFFKSVLGGSASSTAALDRHNQIVREAKEAYTAAGGAAEDWGKKLLAVTRLQADANAREQERAARDAVTALRISPYEIRGVAAGAGMGTPYAKEIEAIGELNRLVAAGVLPVENYRARLDAIGTSTSSDVVRSFALRLLESSEAALEAAGRYAEAQRAVDALTGSMRVGAGHDPYGMRQDRSGEEGREDTFFPTPATKGRQQEILDLTAGMRTLRVESDAWLNQMKVTQSYVRSFASDLTSGLRSGVGLFDALSDAAGNLKDRLIEMALEKAITDILLNIASAFGSALGGGGGTSLMGKLYDTGGYTGPGGRFEPAGIVHRGEFVFSQAATNRIGVPALSRLHRGYSDGGLVTSPVGSFGGVRGGGAAGVNLPVSVHLHGVPAGSAATATTSRGSDGSLNIDVMLRRQIDDTGAAAIGSGESAMNRAIEQRYGLEPVL